jgi:copper transport protein
MRLRPARRPRALAALAAAAVGLLASVLPASPASAHAVLQSTNPVANTTVPTAPAEVVLTFSEPVSPVPDRIRVLAPDGARADRGEPVAREGVLSIPMRTDTPRGTYLVSYRVISADGHPVAGSFTYSVGAPSAAPAADGDQAGTGGWAQVGVAVAKYLGYLGLVLVAGGALVLAALWPRRLPRRGPVRLAWLGLGLVGLATVAGLVLQVPYTTGLPLTGITWARLGEVLGTTFGAAHLVRLGVLLAAAVLLRPLLAGRAGTADRVLLAILAAVGLATWPFAGHAAASPLRAVSVLADAAHLGAVAVWLGGLLMLVAFLLPRASADELDAILPVWSRWAGAAVATLLIAGTVQALIEVGSLSALVGTAYGWMIVAKVGLFGVILAVAAFSRRLVRARTAPGEPRRLRRLVGVELGLAAAVLAVAAVLVQTTPARTAQAYAGLADAQPYSATLTSRLYSLQVNIDPGKTGNNTLHLYAYDEAGKAIPVVEWRATAALPAAGIEPIEIPLLELSDNHVIGEVALPTSGQWEFQFTLRLSEIDQATVSATVPIPKKG